MRWGANKLLNIDDWDPKRYAGAHVTNHGIIILSPRLRLHRNHDELWDALGHEFLHHTFGTDEALAYRFERAIGQALHDLFLGFSPPRCGEECSGVSASRAS